MLSFLLDEHLSPEVAKQLRGWNSQIIVESVQTWRDGLLRGTSDDHVLSLAREACLTLVSYDVSTIAPLLSQRASRGESHGGVIFLDRRTLAQNDFSGQVRALLHQWVTAQLWDWTDVVVFLRPE